ncbi:hypothetical protein EYW49_10240 [Siculibacillus lacustris]|uniref:Uncharacterized protein n=1 Tax=Siculibacillus lacustris TaxID=1549641 RepID=A0A4Q9VSS0_9HYPH|nr:hypothetical protein [Siculibacillus lacustris]TBW37983.1 hypothetical protein EYW49_10240 [Siculibacillus lacustris]
MTVLIRSTTPPPPVPTASRGCGGRADFADFVGAPAEIDTSDDPKLRAPQRSEGIGSDNLVGEVSAATGSRVSIA